MRLFPILVLATNLSFVAPANTAYAHSGGLDGRGGHYNRQTGEYHCHRSSCEIETANKDPRTICNQGYGIANCRPPQNRNEGQP